MRLAGNARKSSGSRLDGVSDGVETLAVLRGKCWPKYDAAARYSSAQIGIDAGNFPRALTYDLRGGNTT